MTDREYWQELADLLGWEVSTFTERAHAQLVKRETRPGKPIGYIAALIPADLREDIMNAVDNAREEGFSEGIADERR